MVGNRYLWLGVAWFALSAGPALAYRVCTMHVTISTWLFGIAYVALLPLLAFSLGMGWRTFGTTIATGVWVACADLWVNFVFSGDASGEGDCFSQMNVHQNPIDWTGFAVFVVMGGFFAVLLRFVMPVVWKPSVAFSSRESRAGWLYAMHAVLLVCVLCLAMGTMVLRIVSERGYVFSYDDGLDMRDRSTVGVRSVGFA